MKASEIRELLKLLERPDIISFAGGIPDPALFPKEAFSAAYTDVLAGEGAAAGLQYSVSEGYKPLRDWLAGEMGKLGIACTADNVFIVSGSQQGLDYLGKLFLSPKDTALVTWPTYLGALQAFNAYEPTYDRLNLTGNRTPAPRRTCCRVLRVTCMPGTTSQSTPLPLASVRAPSTSNIGDHMRPKRPCVKLFPTATRQKALAKLR